MGCLKKNIMGCLKLDDGHWANGPTIKLFLLSLRWGAIDVVKVVKVVWVVLNLTMRMGLGCQ